MNERERIAYLLSQLEAQPIYGFPVKRATLQAPRSQGVYVIRSPEKKVLHVGRTVRGKSGLHQRLRNHLTAQSSFVQAFLGGNGNCLRDGFTYQCLEVANDRDRALLEHIATAWHCPQHLGVGLKIKAIARKPAIVRQ